MGKKLVAYFSATGCTKQVAEQIAEIVNASIYEIKPEKPYSGEDLDWRNSDSRSSREMKDLKSRPRIADDLKDISEYDTVFLGFPIWWYTAPRIVLTFLEKYDFSGKRIVVFATAGSSGFGKTLENLIPSVSGDTIIEMAEVYHHAPRKEDLESWLKAFDKPDEIPEKPAVPAL